LCQGTIRELMRELLLNNCRLDGRYDVIEQLGRGSYAEIFLARDLLAATSAPHSRVVVKALNVFLQDDLDPELERTLVENFQNEAIALDRVRHPNIISRLGHGTARDLQARVFHYLLLEYMAGGNIQMLVGQGRIEMPEALRYIEQICAGLGHAHKHSVIHRDIKPQNLLLNAEHSIVKIADFGVARVTASDAPITRVGTNIYAPPEHSPMLSGRTGELKHLRLTPAADVYSLAKTVYAMLTGEAPRAFANESISKLPDAINREEWADGVLEVLERATQADPDRRYQNVEEFWSALSAAAGAGDDGHDFETVTKPLYVAPQPSVIQGYSPVAPERPSFEAVAMMPSILSQPLEAGGQTGAVAPQETPPGPSTLPRNRAKGRRALTFVLVIAGFTGLLYGTASYLRSNNLFPQTSKGAAAQTGVASTDIYLRPKPGTENEPIGLVTKNSRVRIVNSQNNWYQVDVIQQGRTAPGQVAATRGWLNGKYLDID
jgi:serine/threonine protein kinase